MTLYMFVYRNSGVSKCVTLCCNVLLCVAVYYIHCINTMYRKIEYIHSICSSIQILMCQSVSRCVAMCCCVLQCITYSVSINTSHCVAMCCCVLQCITYSVCINTILENRIYSYTQDEETRGMHQKLSKPIFCCDTSRVHI